MNDDSINIFKCCNVYRFYILIIGTICLVMLQANILLINLAFICMSEDETGLYDRGNGTLSNRFDYSPKEKGLLLSIVAIGTIIGAIFFNFIYIKFGARWPFFFAGIVSAISTGMTPYLAHWSYSALLIGRFIQGLAYSADLAAVGVICVNWAPLAETATFIGVLMSFGPISFSFVNPVVGVFCTSSLGWRWSFFSFGIITSILFTIFLISYSDDPRSHKLVSKRELNRIEMDKTEEHLTKDGFVPYKEICTNWTILVVWFNAFVEVNTAMILLSYAPTYFNKVLGFSITQTSLFTALGSIIHSPLKIIVAILSDCIQCFSERSKLRFFNTIATAIAGLGCLSIGFVPNRDMGVVALTVTCSLMAANSGGFFKCAALVSRQYGNFTMSMMSMTKCLAHLIGPTIVGFITKSDHDSQGWRNVYILNCVLMIIANIIFYPFATGEAAEFTKITRASRMIENEKKKEMKEKMNGMIESVEMKTSSKDV